MLKVIFTLDYEIHDGRGHPYDLMIEPTDRLLNLLDHCGAKLTIFPDIAEILRFKEYKVKNRRDDYCYDLIVEQLQRAVKNEHDVQLHIHPAYFNAKLANNHWCLDFSEYEFASLPYERMDWMIRKGKQFLESILLPVNSNYQCIAFRAANWSVSPSENIVRALSKNNIKIDTSIFKYGKYCGSINFDYSETHHAVVPWSASPKDLCKYDPNGWVWEFPIYSEKRWIKAFINPIRIYNTISGRLFKASNNSAIKRNLRYSDHSSQSAINWLFRKNAWKADFNQCLGSQLVQALIRAEAQISSEMDVPFTLIGHSKLFRPWNERSIKPFIDYIKLYPKRFSFGTFDMFETLLGSK